MEKSYFSYIRVSTAKQGEHGVSLQEQNEAILRYAQRQGLTITRQFEEQETAAKRGRPVFSQMLTRLRRGQASGVVIHKIDRGARNLKDWADLAELIDIGIEVHFANESLDLNTRGGRLSADIQAVVAADYIRNLREETKKGFYGRLKQGLYPIWAPLGYIDCGGGKVKRIDSAKAPLVRMVFELYATGEYSLPRLVDEMYHRGLRNRSDKKVSLNGLSTILRNPFYTGLIRIRKTNEYFPGIHEPIVTKGLFDAAQNVLDGKMVVRTHRHTFAFSRIIRCALCGSTAMAEVQKGYTYYRCHTSGCATKCVREERIDVALDAAFLPLILGNEEISYIREWFTWARANTQLRNADKMEGYKLQLAQLRERLSRLTDAYVDGALDKNTHAERRAKLIVEDNELKKRIEDIQAGDDRSLLNLEDYLERVKTASNLHKLTNPLEKRELVKILTSNLRISDENPAITLITEAQIIANRAQVLSGSPHRGIPRTWDTLLKKLLKHFESEDVPIRRAA